MQLELPNLPLLATLFAGQNRLGILPGFKVRPDFYPGFNILVVPGVKFDSVDRLFFFHTLSPWIPFFSLSTSSGSMGFSSGGPRCLLLEKLHRTWCFYLMKDSESQFIRKKI